MADPTPTPPPPATPHPHSVFNQAQLAALNEADKITTAAQKPAYAAPLAVREITAAYVTQLVADILACRQTGATAAQSTTGKTAATGAQHTAETGLMAALHEVQAAARQKYARTNPVMMNDYLVSHRLNPNQATFKESVQAVITKLGTDTLPGITPAKVANLQTLLTAYTTAAANPTSMQSDATTQRKQRDAQVTSITDRRMTIQFAADAEWPFSVDANAGVRGEFFLPLSQPFHG
ncbi:MAG TPA: hypothetical protein VIK35_12945 [Verrucomicrobiae bacterium]